MLAFTRYPELDFTWFVLKSDTSADEWLATLGEYANQGLTKYELYDLRKARVDIEQFTTDDIHNIVDIQLRPPESKTAMLAKEDVVFGLSRMYDILANMEESITWETRVFYSLSDAVKWLGKDVQKIVLGKRAS
ncbi:MAG: hypothetical protein JRJ39_18135 [Deltaproteobacteria bacterium]|nr:hypothetical protein [Deltaproteobacteria bacterium]